jgi:hypothetical protein
MMTGANAKNETLLPSDVSAQTRPQKVEYVTVFMTDYTSAESASGLGLRFWGLRSFDLLLDRIEKLSD